MFVLLREYLIKLHCKWLQEKFLSVALVICLRFWHTLSLRFLQIGWRCVLNEFLRVWSLCLLSLCIIFSLRGGKVRSLLSHNDLSGCTFQRFLSESVFLSLNGWSWHANFLFARFVVASSSLRFGRNSKIVIQPHLPSYCDIIQDF